MEKWITVLVAASQEALGERGAEAEFLFETVMAAKHLAHALNADIRVFRERRGGLGLLAAEVAK